MNWWQWGIVGVAAWVGIDVLLAVFGWAIGRGQRGRIVVEQQQRIRALRMRLMEAERDPAHARCRKVEQRQADEIVFLEDQARDGFDPVAEAQQILDLEAGS
jgi:hypothetical protein